ncbi:ABC transporter ATP-binding protein [Termitidicoccus mucosus]|uniref:ABC transporter ATP-binding protein n=1 Tax=Termitidicoccus mucosus TaxID=1184151 RepID=UPI003183F137
MAAENAREAHGGMSGGGAILRAVNLHCGYGCVEVLGGVNLEAREGEVLALIGPNGTGKTTLLHTLGRLLPAQRGEVRLGGRALRGMRSREVARMLALAPQRAPHSAWPLAVAEAVARAAPGWLLPLTAADQAAVDAAMARMRVAALAGRTLSTLSGGELRRVILARALAQAPRVLLLDEPATYLDLQHQAELLALVRSLARDDGLAVVLTMHDLSLAALCADRVALLAPGGLRVTGTPAEVLREEILRPVYGERLEVFAHPASGSPVVLPLAER